MKSNNDCEGNSSELAGNGPSKTLFTGKPEASAFFQPNADASGLPLNEELPLDDLVFK